MTSVADYLASSANLDSDTHRLDMELLLSMVMEKPRTWIISHSEFLLTSEQSAHLHELVCRRRSGEPMAYILGYKEFWSREFSVTKDTLIPRPETETLVQQALELMTPASCRVLDLGTGSGAIAITLKIERPDWEVMAVDISPAALIVAGKNCFALSSTVSLVCSDWGEAIGHEHFDLVVCNPPYVAPGDPHLKALSHEPITALVASDGEFSAIDTIISQCAPGYALSQKQPGILRSGGRLLLEHGYNQAQSVCDKLAVAGYSDIQSFTDDSGQPRVSTGIIEY